MKLSEKYLSKNDIALADFAKAIALPIRVCIIRIIIENGNRATRDKLFEIAYDRQTINRHILDLKYLKILKSSTEAKISYFSVDEEMFVAMSSQLLNLFETASQFIPVEQQVVRKPILRKKKIKVKLDAIELQNLPFGQYIKGLRKRMNLTQGDVADKLQINREHFSRIECGKKVLKFEKLTRLAEVLNVEPGEMLSVFYNDQLSTSGNEKQEI